MQICTPKNISHHFVFFFLFSPYPLYYHSNTTPIPLHYYSTTTPILLQYYSNTVPPRHVLT
ncbi:MAG: hypothetical protein K6D57_04960 [Paludibacteraceae bacterium]|nr:hypothetical protein [Paludibacteraceae bacterium]